MKEKTPQQLEAIQRMEQLKLMGQVIGDFKRNGKVYYSERQNAVFNAVLYWLDNNPKWVSMVKEFESKTGALVYHAQLTHTECGDLLSLLYVSADKNEWLLERQDIAKGYVYSKVINLDDEWCSDYGYIQLKPSMGGVVRIA